MQGICFRAKKKKKKNRLVVCCRSCIALSPALISSPSSCAIRELFFAAFVFPSFFRTGGLDLSSNKYQKLVLILVNTGQVNDKEWDELFYWVFSRLQVTVSFFFFQLETNGIGLWGSLLPVGRIYKSTSRILDTSRES